MGRAEDNVRSLSNNGLDGLGGIREAARGQAPVDRRVPGCQKGGRPVCLLRRTGDPADGRAGQTRPGPAPHRILLRRMPGLEAR